MHTWNLATPIFLRILRALPSVHVFWFDEKVSQIDSAVPDPPPRAVPTLGQEGWPFRLTAFSKLDFIAFVCLLNGVGERSRRVRKKKKEEDVCP